MGFDLVRFTLICVNLMHTRHGDVTGTGARQLHLARGGQNHFASFFLKQGLNTEATLSQWILFQPYELGQSG